MRRLLVMLGVAAMVLSSLPTNTATASAQTATRTASDARYRSLLPPVVERSQATTPRPGASAAIPAPVSANVMVNPADSHSYIQPLIVDNPAAPGSIYAASDTGTALTAGFRSQDNGATWAESNPPLPPSAPNYITTSPAPAFDASGVLYESYVGVDRAGNSQLVLAVSRDQGATWSSTTTIASISEQPDANRTAVDTTSGPYRGRIYVAYSANPAANPSSQPLMLAWSSDGGATWSKTQIWDSGGDVGAVPVVGPNGEVYVGWDDYCGGVVGGQCSNRSGQLLVAKSTNGGASFGAPVRIDSTTIGFGANLASYSASGPIGSNCPRTVPPALSLAVDRTGGVHNGTIYAAWGDRQPGAFPPDRLHIYSSKSTDGGAHWLSRSQIDTGNIYDAWEPAVAVDQSSGVVTAVWYDRRDFQPNTIYYPDYFTYYAQSTDGGLNFLSTQLRVADQFSNAQLNCSATANYLGIVAANGVAHPVWTDTRSGTDRIYTASIDERAAVRPIAGFGTVPFPGFTAASPISSDGCCNFIPGHFTSDGHLDLLKWRDGQPAAVFAGNGDGTFRSPQWTTLTNGSIAWVGAADLNRDGKLDLVFETLEPAIWTALGNGDGTFQTPTRLYLGTSVAVPQFGGSPQLPIVADVNGDGIPDLIVPLVAIPQGNAYSLQVLIGNGDGTFRFGSVQALPGPPLTMAAAAFTSDGKVDLAIGNGAGGSTPSLVILKGDGLGNFGPFASYDAGGPSKIVTADMRRIGRRDVVVSSWSSTTAAYQVLVFLNSGGTGQSVLQSPATYPLASQPLDVVAADFNNDGYVDLAIRMDESSDGKGGLTIMLGSATGALSVGESYGSVSNHSVVGSLVAADFDENGTVDLLAGPYLLLGRGDGTFIAPRHFATGPQPGKVVTGDFNRDGKLDVAVINNNCCFTGMVSVLLGNGDGTFQAPVAYTLPNPAIDLVVGDFNGDGIPDLAVANGTQISVLLGNGDGTFKTPINTPVAAGTAAIVGIATGEFNGDTKPDLVVLTSSSVITLLLGKGDGSFTTGQSYSGGASVTSPAIAVADVNKDGKSDVLLANYSGVTVYLGNGDGTLSQKSVLPCQTAGAIVTGDLNGDGNLDLVVVNGSLGCVFLGNGDGTFQSAPPAPVLQGAGLALADFDGDGKLDLAVTSFYGDGLLVYPGRGDGTFSVPSTYAAGSRSIASGDFNGDGLPDLVAIGADLDVLLGRPIKATLSATTLGFGTQAIGTAAPTQSVTFTNAGAVPISMVNAGIVGTNVVDFSRSADSCSGARILPAATCSVTVRFQPAGAGSRTATLSFMDNARGSPQAVTLAGTGTGALVNLSPSPVTFGNRLLGSGASAGQTITLTNSGNAAVHVGALSKSGSNTGDFTLSGDACSGATVNAGAQCTFALSFTPGATGPRTATIAVADDANGSPHNISVSGAGTFGGQFTPLSPVRILDTRNGTGGYGSPLGPNSTITVGVGGQGGVPAYATAAVLNVTVTDTTGASYLTVFPTGVARPLASNLNWVAGMTVPNLVEVALGTNGAVDVFNPGGYVDVIFDVAGYVVNQSPSPGPTGFYNPLVPSRILDTRDGTGGWRGQFLAYKTYPVQVAGWGGAPLVGDGAAVLNVTVTNPTAAGYVTVWPNDGSASPKASNLNFVAGQTVPNRVAVKLGPTGWINITVWGANADVIADLGGWFTDSGLASGTGGGFSGLTPARILDTRYAVGATQALVCAGGKISVPVAGQGGVPAVTSTSLPPPTGAVLNVTVTNTTNASYLTVWPDGSTQPLASDLNWTAGLTVPNLVVVRLGANGNIAIYNSGGCTDVVADVVGWYG